MMVNKINRYSQNQPQASASKLNAQTYNYSNVKKMSQQSSGISPLSSRYTYAIGQDGKRYVLQLRIDISSIRAFSSFA